MVCTNPTHTDAELLLRYQENQANDVLAELQNRYTAKLSVYLRNSLDCHENEIPDILQLTWLRVHAKVHLYDPEYSVKAWLYEILQSTAKNYFRHKTAIKRGGGAAWESVDLNENTHPPTLAGSLLDVALKGEQSEQLAACLDRLKVHDRRIIESVYYEGLSMRAAAESLGIPKTSLSIEGETASHLESAPLLDA